MNDERPAIATHLGDRARTLPRYEPPPLDSDAPLDPIERSLVRMFVALIVDEIREEQAVSSTDRDGQTGTA